MIQIFEKMMADPDKMAIVKRSPFSEAAFHALYAYVKNGGDLLDLPWFAASKSARESHK